MSSGMPRSRSSSLSRSNMRLNASNESGYPGTAARIWVAVRYRWLDSRQTTRLSSRSVFRFDIALVSLRVSYPYSPLWLPRRGPFPGPSYPAGVIRWRDAVVAAVRREWPGAVELDVTSGGAAMPALAYPALTGRPQVGDRVLLNVTALELGLGTGGYALVVAVPERLPDGPAGSGHLVKARYTPLQATVLGADEQGSPHHEVLAGADDLGGMPVVVADLHSALPAVLAALRAGFPDPRVAYVMLDGGALPAWFSRTTAALREAGWLAGTVTVGQAFGGDLEAVTLHTGLLAA